MLGPEDFMTIQALVKRGVYIDHDSDFAPQWLRHHGAPRAALPRIELPRSTGGRRFRLACPVAPELMGNSGCSCDLAPGDPPSDGVAHCPQLCNEQHSKWDLCQTGILTGHHSPLLD